MIAEVPLRLGDLLSLRSEINKKMMPLLIICRITAFLIFGWADIKRVLKMSLLVIGHG